eukprot:TRINITY_DN62198_c0_g1_i1.p1 TRINITY_DN62198_c0_g1~~TRINITY_DN62198_c0_g1_i1.p1  ORF type:complete len:309 (+),score=49.60 TRINITY_DN62198_c0_g1_i1:82-1008(+)
MPYSAFAGAYTRQAPGPAPSNVVSAGFTPGKRKRLNLVAIAINVLGPWLVFCGIFAAMSSQMHFISAPFAWSTVIAGLALSAIAGMMAQRSKARDRDPTWFTFSCLALLIATLLGAILGDLNYAYNMQPFFDIENISMYPSVNPAREKGQQMMDAGRVDFAEGSGLDTTKAMAFRSLDMYCVAPIVNGHEPLASYDFWAVGVNCCSATNADFRCGEYNNPKARSGLRLMRQDQRPFFRLAVQQAEAAYNIKATHPLFFYWMQDPLAEVMAYQSAGYKFGLCATSGYFLFNLICVTGCAFAFSKLSHEF